MSDIGVSLRYTRALAGAAEARGVLDRVQEDVRGLLDLIRESEDLQGVLGDTLVHPEQKQNLFQTLFSGKIDDLTLDFLLLLCEKRRERTLEEILQGVVDVLDERRGVVTAQVRSARALTPEQQGRLSQGLSAYSGKQVRLEAVVDAGMGAGFVARLGGEVFDATLDAQLVRLRRRLTVGATGI